MAKISIITITYNAESVLEKTILSIVTQKKCNIEYIIVDGKSKDGTVDIIKKYEKDINNRLYPAIKPADFHWISEPDKGLYDAMNKGINLANGDFLWFMNAGDKIFDELTVQKIEEAINADSSVDVVYGQSLMIGLNDEGLGERHKIAPANLNKKSLLNGLVVCHQSILARKEIAPLYDLKYKISADYDWTIKVIERSRKNYFINNYISKFMIAGLSAQKRKESWSERFSIMKKHFGLLRTLWAHFIIILKYPFTRKY